MYIVKFNLLIVVQGHRLFNKYSSTVFHMPSVVVLGLGIKASENINSFGILYSIVDLTRIFFECE